MSETEPESKEAPEALGVTWEEFLRRCRKGLNYVGAVSSFIGRKLTELGSWLESID